MEDGGADVAEAQDVLDSLGVDPSSLGLDLGQEEAVSSARAPSQPEQDDQEERESKDERNRQAWTRRQQNNQGRNAQLEALQNQVTQLAQQNAAFFQQMQRAQQAPQTNQEAAQTWDEIDPTYRKYLETTLGTELDRRFENLTRQQQQLLAPILQQQQQQQRQAQMAYQLQQQHQSVQAAINQNIAELQQYAAQPENAGFNDRYVMYEDALGSALRRAGKSDGEIQQVLMAQAMGMSDMAHQLQIHPGYLFDLYMEELSSRWVGQRTKTRAVTQTQRQNQNAARLAPPTPPGRGGRAANPMSAALEKGNDFSVKDVRALAKVTPRRGMSRMAAMLVQQAEAME